MGSFLDGISLEISGENSHTLRSEKIAPKMTLFVRGHPSEAVDIKNMMHPSKDATRTRDVHAYLVISHHGYLITQLAKSSQRIIMTMYVGANTNPYTAFFA